MKRRSAYALALSFAALGASSGLAQTKRPLTHDDYDRWPSIRARAWSADGKWLAYSVDPAWGDGVLHVRQVDGEARSSHPRGSSPRFSLDGRYLVYTEKKSVVEEREKKLRALRGEKVEESPARGASAAQAPSSASSMRARMLARMQGRRGARGAAPGGRGTVVVLDLETGAKQRIEGARSSRVLADGRYLVVQLDAPTPTRGASARVEGRSPASRRGRRGRRAGGTSARGASAPRSASAPTSRPGGTLLLRAMESGELRRFGGVTRYWPLADDGWLALRVVQSKAPAAKPAAAGAPERGAKAAKKEAEPGEKAAQGAEGAKPAQGAKPEKPAKPEPFWKKLPETKLADGLHAVRLADGQVFALLEGEASFDGLVTDREHQLLAFTSDLVEKRKADAAAKAAREARAKARRARAEGGAAKRADAPEQGEPKKAEKPRSDVYFWRFGDSRVERVITHATPGLPKDATIEGSGLSFSKDGSVLSFRVREPEPEPLPKILDDEKVVVDIWHFQDGLIQPQQARSRGRSSRSLSCVWHVAEERCVVLGDEKIRSVSMLTRDGSRALASDGTPYERAVAYDARYSDYYLVNTFDGTRRKLLERSRTRPQSSPSGRYLMHFADDGQWHLHDIALGSSRCLTSAHDVAWANETEDRPQPARAYGVAGWTEGEQSVLVYDRYDIWIFDVLSGGGRCLTDGFGRANRVVLRASRFDYRGDADELSEDAKEYLREPLFLTAKNDVSKASGYYLESLYELAKPKKLAMWDAAVGGLGRAKEGDRVFFTLSRFDQFPDILCSTLDFARTERLTRACPEQDEVRWGRAELVSWRNNDGDPLQGILVKPEGFDPQKKYPMLVYFYERNADNVHRYTRPAAGTSPNAAYYVSNGYLWFVPDIVYTVGYPGESAEKCVISGVQSLIARGFVDEKAIGIAGHSWGGYQTAHLVTRSKLFAAAESGAPVSNMFSAYGGIRYQSGMSRQFQYERTQSRIGGTPWEYPQRYWQNSPVFYADRVETPVLILHNDNDGAVPWTNGIEFFMALRRLDKEAYLFNYNGEPHGLRKDANKRDWTRRMSEFFAHHLRGADKPAWMEKGVPYAEREREKIQWARSRREAEAKKRAAELEATKPVSVDK